MPLIGFPTAVVTYDPARRFGGIKYPLKKSAPLHGRDYFSLATKLAFGLPVSALESAFLSGLGIFGSADLSLLQGGCGRMGLGFDIGFGWRLASVSGVGSGRGYVGKTYGEVKARPRYHIEMLLERGKHKKRHNIFCRPFG